MGAPRHRQPSGPSQHNPLVCSMALPAGSVCLLGRWRGARVYSLFAPGSPSTQGGRRRVRADTEMVSLKLQKRLAASVLKVRSLARTWVVVRCAAAARSSQGGTQQFFSGAQHQQDGASIARRPGRSTVAGVKEEPISAPLRALRAPQVGARKVWLDPNEVNDISMANSSACARTLGAMQAVGGSCRSKPLLRASSPRERSAAAATPPLHRTQRWGRSRCCRDGGACRRRRPRSSSSKLRMRAFQYAGQNIRKLIKDGFIIRKPAIIHSRSRARTSAEAKSKGRHTGYGEQQQQGAAAAAAGGVEVAGRRRWPRHVCWRKVACVGQDGTAQRGPGPAHRAC